MFTLFAIVKPKTTLYGMKRTNSIAQAKGSRNAGNSKCNSSLLYTTWATNFTVWVSPVTSFLILMKQS